MIQIIAGDKGKGKTKFLLEKVNTAVKTAEGNLVFLDKNTKHMFELNNKVRLITVKELPVENTDEFLGFLCGIVSQDNDLEELYLDSFLTIARIPEGNDAEIERAVKKLEVIGDKFNIKFVISISRDADKLPESAKKYVEIAL